MGTELDWTGKALDVGDGADVGYEVIRGPVVPVGRARWESGLG